MNRKMRKITAFVMLLVLTTGCGKKNASTETTENLTDSSQTTLQEASEREEADENKNDDEIEIDLPEQSESEIDYTTAEHLELPAGTHIAVVSKSTKDPFFKAVEKGMEQAIADLNEEAGLTGDDRIVMTYEAPSDHADTESQINMVDAVLAENPQAFCLSAIDMASCEAQLETAEENGIPVTIFDSGILSESGNYRICQTDNYAAGEEAARHIGELLEEKEEILIVASRPGSESVVQRLSGFEQTISNSSKEVTVYETLYKDDEEDARSLSERIEEVLNEHPGISGIFATDEEVSSDVLSVLTEASDIIFVGFDANSEQIQAIRDGIEAGTVCQNPYGMGYATIIMAARSILLQENDEVVDAGFQWIDSSNVDLEENQKYLYE